MRTWTLCSQCATDMPGAETKVYVELNDALLFDTKCPRGHPILQTLETTRFSLLFDFGIAAMSDGYFREAVSSFAAAVERLHEFSIRVICKRRGVSIDMFDKGWKDIASQSERQLGAFSMLYLSQAKCPPSLIDSKFRNKVIHKGYLPNAIETFKYAKEVHDNMLQILMYICENLQGESDAVWIEERAARANGRTELQTTSHGNANFISRTLDPVRSTMTFEEKLKIFAKGWPESRWIFK